MQAPHNCEFAPGKFSNVGDFKRRAFINYRFAIKMRCLIKINISVQFLMKFYTGIMCYILFSLYSQQSYPQLS